MSKVTRRERITCKTFKIFCEGDTEYNYFNGFRKDKKLKISLKPINMDGGGYSNFLSQLRQDGNANCLAKFIIVDGDKAHCNPAEYEKLVKLIEYCQIQNASGRIPHIMIINYPDFEYVACLHSPLYKGQDVRRFIETGYKFKNLDSFKADENVYVFLNSNGNSYNNLVSSVSKMNSIIKNQIKIKKSLYEISVVLNVDYNKLGIKGSNIGDFFYVMKTFEPTV